MATISEALAHAYDLRRSGQLEQAERVCRQIVAVMPAQREAWELLGSIAFQLQNFAVAAECFERVAGVAPVSGQCYYNLAVSLHELGDPHRASVSYRQAIAMDPNLAEAHNNLGNILRDQGQPVEAIACYRRAIEIRPDLASAYNNLGNALRDLGQQNDAIVAYRRALELGPHAAETHVNIGNILRQKTGKEPEFPSAVGTAAEPSADEIAAHVELGNALYHAGQRQEAAKFYEQALSLDPFSANAHNNLGAVLRELGKREEARACFERAIHLQPHHADAHWNLSLVLLSEGEYERGWREFEWRWHTGRLTRREFPQPLWTGESLDGKVVLLETEQGFGDTIQFIRYALLVKERGATVLLNCAARLKLLLQTCPGIDRCVPYGAPLPEFDYHMSLLSLPGVFKTSESTIPTPVPYLFAESSLVRDWSVRLPNCGGLRVGINWHGRSGPGVHRERDIPLSHFFLLSQVPDVTLISLQLGDGREELDAYEARSWVYDPGDEIDVVEGAFMDTAAIMTNLDLVVTSDTAIAHLAGALGIPVWVALPYVADWRWMPRRTDSLWYPTMRLFRQLSPGDWSIVFETIQAALKGIIVLRRGGRTTSAT